MNTMRWSQVSAFVALPLVAALLAACSKPATVEEPVRAVRTLVLSETGGALEREFAADIRARTESRLSFRVAGKVNRRLVELGQAVRAGQVLAQLDPIDLKLGEDAARAGLAAAEANAAQASADLKRFTELKAQGFISDAELDRHVTANKTAQASLQQARAQAGVQTNQASYAALVAGASGVITSVDLEPGQVVNAGLPVLTLAHDGPRDAVFSVPEDMGPVVRPLVGKPGALKLRRWGTSEWVPATLREIAAATDSLTRTYLAKADVGAAAGFDLGQTAVVMLNAPVRVTGGVRVPLNALAERDGKSVVWVLNPQSMTVQPAPVVTGDVTGNVVLLAKGVTPGQEIVTAGIHVLTPGQHVRRYQLDAAVPASGPASAAQR
jgi:multidrug efflux system membrane fusion protein